MNCRHARQALHLQLDQSLQLERELALEAHLADCESCRLISKRTQVLEETLMGLPDPPVERLDVERSVSLVRARCAAEPSGASTAARTWWRVAAALGAAAAALVLWIALRGAEINTSTQVSQPPLISKTGTISNQEPQGEAPPSQAQLEQHAPVSATLPPLDVDLLTAVREEIRAALGEASAELGLDATHEEVLAFAELFEHDTLVLRRNDWPVRRIVQGSLTSTDLVVASAAARYLGVRAGSSAARHLRSALEREDLAPSAVLALIDLGEAGSKGLAMALEFPLVREVALDGLVRLGGPAPASGVAKAIESTADTERSWRQALLMGLGSMGTASLPALLELQANGVLDDQELLAVLENIPAASEWFASGLKRGRLKNPRRFLSMAVMIAPSETLAWLKAQLYDRSHQELACELLPTIAGARVVASLIELHEDARLSSDDLISMLAVALETDTDRFVALAESRSSSSTSERRTLLEMLLALPEPSSGLRALIASLGATDLPESARCEAALRIGESLANEALPTLTRVFADCRISERKLAAACLLGIDRIGGDEAVAIALDGGLRQATQNIRSLLQRREAGGGTTPSIYKLARELKPFLSARDSETRRTSS